jgi:hypothetical protein
MEITNGMLQVKVDGVDAIIRTSTIDINGKGRKEEG